MKKLLRSILLSTMVCSLLLGMLAVPVGASYTPGDFYANGEAPAIEAKRNSGIFGYYNVDFSETKWEDVEGSHTVRLPNNSGLEPLINTGSYAKVVTNTDGDQVLQISSGDYLGSTGLARGATVNWFNAGFCNGDPDYSDQYAFRVTEYKFKINDAENRADFNLPGFLRVYHDGGDRGVVYPENYYLVGNTFEPSSGMNDIPLAVIEPDVEYTIELVVESHVVGAVARGGDHYYEMLTDDYLIGIYINGEKVTAAINDGENLIPLPETGIQYKYRRSGYIMTVNPMTVHGDALIGSIGACFESTYEGTPALIDLYYLKHYALNPVVPEFVEDDTDLANGELSLGFYQKKYMWDQFGRGKGYAMLEQFDPEWSIFKTLFIASEFNPVELREHGAMALDAADKIKLINRATGEVVAFDSSNTGLDSADRPFTGGHYMISTGAWIPRGTGDNPDHIYLWDPHGEFPQTINSDRFVAKFDPADLQPGIRYAVKVEKGVKSDAGNETFYDYYLNIPVVGDSDVTIEDVKISKNGAKLDKITDGAVKFDVTVSNNAALTTASVLAVAYETAGGIDSLADVAVGTLTYGANDTDAASLTVNVPAGTAYVKLFVWDDLMGISPYSISLSYNK